MQTALRPRKDRQKPQIFRGDDRADAGLLCLGWALALALGLSMRLGCGVLTAALAILGKFLAVVVVVVVALVEADEGVGLELLGLLFSSLLRVVHWRNEPHFTVI